MSQQFGITQTGGMFTGEHSAARNFLFSAIFWLTIADFIGLIGAIATGAYLAFVLMGGFGPGGGF